MIIIDPVTQQRIVCDEHCGDIVYDLKGEKAVIQEDVSVIGPWKDWTGSGGPNSRTQQMWAGHGNRFQGTDAGIKGLDLDNLTKRGKSADTHRSRTIKRYYDLKTRKFS